MIERTQKNVLDSVFTAKVFAGLTDISRSELL